MGRLIDAIGLKQALAVSTILEDKKTIEQIIDEQPTIEPEPKTGHWILNRSGAYCCDKCMEPCATYVMMKPRDKYCKMCGAKMERRQDGH